MIVCIVIAVTIIGLSLALFALWSRAGNSGLDVGVAHFGAGSGWGVTKRKKIPRPTCESIVFERVKVGISVCVHVCMNE